ncbi:S1 RNA-binding domain-containing protein [Streptomyces sp. HUCO-GS316]|uniref:S1 RNA-binding domain-containing protein n=1 Tax=Streptomyces sp. HUCO-GS316 TaxID=2692198 RepID=UPI001371501D|nr:S1 RNA-binding domain-containing protein [Streptomyces sp. HUCO-GS316]
MAISGTDAYETAVQLPPLVERALAAARNHGFPYSCRPEQGRLLYALAGGARTLVGETGTGFGVGLAWLASGAGEGVRLVSVEWDPERARVAAEVFADRPGVEVLTGDWRRIGERGPYDLLVLDGGGQGKADGDHAAGVGQLLAPGGTVVVDDFTPATSWPPLFEGRLDRARRFWMDHPDLRSAELRLAPDLSVVVGTRRLPAPERLGGVEPGRIVRGRVTCTPHFGVFVDLGDGVQGYVSPVEITWRRFEAIEDVVRVGQEVTAEVLDVDAEREQVRLSFKALEPDPLSVFARGALGRICCGTVTKVVPFGVFVQVADGVEGLVQRDELLGDPRVGDELTVEVTQINLRRRRISVTLV